MSVTECADALMAMLKLSRYAQTTDSRQKLRDLGLAAYVRAALRNDERTEKLLITVTVTNGQAELSGTTEASASAEIRRYGGSRHARHHRRHQQAAVTRPPL